MNTQKIHFVNRVDDDNAGDLVCSPYNYYYDFFKDYNIIRHDIDYINWIEISKHDVVIVGGGGMLYVTEDFQKNMNKLFDICPTVIAWSIGFNMHSDRPVKTPIDTGRFKLIGIRDYLHPSGLPYLPCVSCLAVELEKILETKRHIGIIDHKYFPVTDDIDGERINNAESFQTITDFIASSEIVVSSSYHNIYWAHLMGKKAICANPFSTKFDYFQYKPIFYSGDFEKDISQAQIYPQALTEARKLNVDFFEKAKNVIKNVITEKSKNYQYVYDTTIPALLRRRQEDTENRIIWALEEKSRQLETETKYLRDKINRLHNRISEDINTLHEKTNVSNAEIHALQEEKNRLNNEINSLSGSINASNEIIRSLHTEIEEKTSLRYFAKKVKAFIRKRIIRLG